MSFLEQLGLIETEEQERERLAQSPEGSINHRLSQLPETIVEWPQDLIIELPQNEHRIVVVPIKYNGENEHDRPKPWQRHSGSWDCAIVYTDHPDYRVGGYRICVGADELARGKKVGLAL